MSKFIRNQYVKYIRQSEASEVPCNLVVGKIYQITSIVDYNGFEEIGLNHLAYFYNPAEIEFETVIRSLDDIVRGMTLTWGLNSIGIVKSTTDYYGTVTLDNGQYDAIVHFKDFKEYKNLGNENKIPELKATIPKFVKGQLVKCISVPLGINLELYSIHRIKEVCVEYESESILLEGTNQFYNTEDVLFNTVIYNINDVVIGMELTLIGYNSKYKVTSINPLTDSICITNINHINTNNININKFKEFVESNKLNYLEEKGLSLTTAIKDKYKVIKPFNVVDLYTSGNLHCNKFLSEYGKLLKSVHKKCSLNTIFENMSYIREHKILNNNLEYLEEKGYIQRVIKEVILEPGMKLERKDRSGIFEIIEIMPWDKTAPYYFLHITKEGKKVLFQSPENRGIPYTIFKNTTLNELNKKWYKLIIKTNTLWSIIN